MESFVRKGFSLIEMAFVLIIVSIILGMGTGLYITFIKWNKKKTTSETLRKISDNLIGYLSSEVNGFDISSIPKVKDAYLQKVIFIGSDKLSKNFLSSHNATICDIKNSELSFKDENTNSTINNVAFVLFSKGEDYQSDTYCNSVKVENDTFCTGTVKSDSSKDLYNVVTLDEVKNFLGCLGNPIKIFPQYLPTGVVGESYSASITASGGIKPYKWCYSGKLPDGISINPKSLCPSYQQANEVSLSGTPNSAGDSKFTVCVKDSNSPEPYSKCMEFAITINLSSGNGTSGGGPSNCTEYSLDFSTVNLGKEWIWLWPLRHTYNGRQEVKEYIDLIPSGRSSHYTFPSNSNQELEGNDIVMVEFMWHGKVSHYIPIEGNMADLDNNGDCLVDIRCTVPPDYDGSDVSVVTCTTE